MAVQPRATTNGASSQAHQSRYVNRLNRSRAARFERLQGQVDLSGRNFNSSSAIRAIQSWICTALGVVPTHVVIRRCGLRAWNSNAICHRSC